MLGESFHGSYGSQVGKPNSESSAAADSQIQTTKVILVVPKGSPVAFACQDRTLRACFTGSFIMTGSWHFAWCDDETYDLTFEPDDEMLLKLPYWKCCEERACTISFENPDEFFHHFLKYQARARLRRRRQLSVYGRAAISVDRFSTTVECDWPFYRVRFLDAVTPATSEN